MRGVALQGGPARLLSSTGNAIGLSFVNKSSPVCSIHLISFLLRTRGGCQAGAGAGSAEARLSERDGDNL